MTPHPHTSERRTHPRPQGASKVAGPMGSPSPRPTLTPAHTAQRRPDARMMVVQRDLPIRHTTVSHLTEVLEPGDLLVVNDAATLPSSLQGHHLPTGEPLELRLAANLNPEHHQLTHWIAVVFGEGDWRQDTEHRPPPPHMSPGDRLLLSDRLTATIEKQLHPSGRLVTLTLDADQGDIWGALYQVARPIQYAYHTKPLEVWDQQTLFAGPPVAVEPPSSGFHLTWSLIFALQERGVEVVPITHGTGLSTTGDPQLDRRWLPLFEPTWITPKAAERIHSARRSGRRIIAMGTGVTRALESMTDANGQLHPGRALTLLRLSAQTHLRTVTGLLTGLHQPGSSHAHLLESFIPAACVCRTYHEALQHGYLGHEYGDIMLVFAAPPTKPIAEH
ncbi:MAG: S-adenosylmethionine:tRNA ribosyltransferase-isomerase [Myxococcota bacterium]